MRMRSILAALLMPLWAATAAAQYIPPINTPAAGPVIMFAVPAPSQYAALFSDDSQWPMAAKRVGVISLVSGWINNSATDADLARIIAFAKTHRMKLNLSLQAVAKIPGQTCGGIEGYSFPGEMLLAMRRILALGGTIDWFDMDEPIWFGHYFTGDGGCQIPVNEMITRISTILNQVLPLAPNARLIDIEPLVDIMHQKDWRETLRTIWAGVERLTGRRVGILELDVAWGTPEWRPYMVTMNQFLRQQNMGLAVIYNGTFQETSNAAWVARAIGNADIVEGALGIIPEVAVFASWDQFGQNNLPETSNTSQTWLINRYARDRSVLTASFSGTGAQGKLTTKRGAPIANATIQAAVPGLDLKNPLPVLSITGTVPANAATAVMGIRLNMECGCQGLNDVLVGTSRYQESLGGSVLKTFGFSPAHAVYNGVIVDGEVVGGTLVTRFIAPAGKSFLTNSDFFPVTPGAHYQFSVPAGTLGGDGWYGNVILIFVAADGQGLARPTITPDPGHVAMPPVTTAADGSYKIPRLPHTGPGSAPVTVWYGGDDVYRGAAWSPVR